MSDFPSTEGLGKSQDGSELVYGGSIAINRQLGRLRDLAGQKDAPPYLLYLINVYTLVDNIYSKDTKVSILEDLLTTEINILTTYIEAYSSHFNSYMSKSFKPTIIFYIPEYNIPSKYRREIDSKTQKGKIKLFYDLIRKSFGRNIVEMSSTGNSYRYMLPVGHVTYPHREIVPIVQRLSSKIDYMFGSGPVGLISHITLDLHIGRLIPNIHLLERYTGDVLTYSQFGKKLDKGGRVPFNVYTHRAFGDDLLLEPLVQRKLKKELLEVAEKKRWMRLSPGEIAVHIKDVTGVSIADLGVLKI
jgi:hypothetical protein